MSRVFQYDGPPVDMGPAALWTFQSKTIVLPAFPNRVALYPPPGPVLVEWFMVSADPNNTDLVYFGTQNVTFGAPFQGWTALGASEFLLFEPNDKGISRSDGLIVAPDGDHVEMELMGDVDLVDVSQFFVTPGNLAVAGSYAVQCTIGSRSRR